MRKTIFTALAAVALFTACKKDEPVPEVPAYPATYKFESAGNASGISVFTKTALINAPNHASATDSEIANFAPFLADQTSSYGDIKFTLLDASRIVYTDITGSDTAIYTTSGDNIIVEGSVFKKTANSLLLSNFFSVTSLNDGFGGTTRTAIVGEIGSSNLKDAVQFEMSAGDTTAARSFDLVFKKQ